MPVGKAKAVTMASASDAFTFVVPCCTSIDEARIRDHLERDHFFWLDLTGPSFALSYGPLNMRPDSGIL
jgi:hypothetical protein